MAAVGVSSAAPVIFKASSRTAAIYTLSLSRCRVVGPIALGRERRQGDSRIWFRLLRSGRNDAIFDNGTDCSGLRAATTLDTASTWPSMFVDTLTGALTDTLTGILTDTLTGILTDTS